MGHRGSGVVAWGDRTSGLAVAAASLLGVAAFLYPFLLPTLSRTDDAGAHAADAPLIFAGLSVLCLLATLAVLGQPGSGAVAGATAKSVALLGVLVATDATLRLAPSLLGATPIFLLIILVGAVFGPSFGFLMGSLTLLVSAFLTGGIGPWLPFEMLGAGWVGLTAGWLPRPANPRRRLLLLAAFGAGWGFLYGAILNLYFWPFAAPGLGADVGLYWVPGLTLPETIDRYARFYLVTSLGHDLFRAAGNALLILALGGPLLRTLERFRVRFAWRTAETNSECRVPSAES